MSNEGCNLPSHCECELCKYWGENGWDVSRTPSWQQTSFGEPDDWQIMEEEEAERGR